MVDGFHVYPFSHRGYRRSKRMHTIKGRGKFVRNKISEYIRTGKDYDVDLLRIEARKKYGHDAV